MFTFIFICNETFFNITTEYADLTDKKFQIFVYLKDIFQAFLCDKAERKTKRHICLSYNQYKDITGIFL